jgi:hypothetical protein
MKKLILLSLMMLVCGKSFSQTDTKNKVVIDTSLAKKIAIDLVKGDECKEELKIVYKNISLLENKVLVKDSIINVQKNQITNFGKMVDGKEKLLNISNDNLKNTQRQLKKSKFNSTFYKLTTLALIGITGVILVK